MASLLTEAELTTIIKNHLKSEETPTVLSTSFQECSSLGFISKHYVLNLEFQSGNGMKKAQFFVKTSDPSNEVLHEFFTSLKVYDKEDFFYNFLCEEFGQLGINLDYAPAPIFSKTELLVLEDVSLGGFRPLRKGELFDLDHCKVALETLADFHASGIALEEKLQLTLDNFSEILEDELFAKTNSLGGKWFQCSVEGIRGIVFKLEEFPRDEFSMKIEELLARVPELSKPSEKYKNVLLHGDLWVNNFLFCYEDSEPRRAKLVDFQFVKYGPLCKDVLHLVLSNTRRSLREGNFHSLLEFYREKLIASLGRYNLQGEKMCPREAFEESCKEYEPCVRLQVIADRCVTFLPENCNSTVEELDTSNPDCNNPESNSSNIINSNSQCSNSIHSNSNNWNSDDSNVNISNANSNNNNEVKVVVPSEKDETRRFLYEKRKDVIVRALEDPNFREIITEDINELRDVLLA